MIGTATLALYDMYVSEKKNIYSVIDRCNNNMSGPFLVSPNRKYLNSKVKLAFVGQETKGWTSHRDIEMQMKVYEDFNLGEKYYSSPFWNVMRKFEKALCGDTYCSAWLNINRYDEMEKRPSQESLAELSKLDSIIVAELKILNPDIVIFLTGHSYDSRIVKILGARQSALGGFDMKKLCHLDSDLIAGRIFRTYHPNYLRRSGMETGVIEAITSEVEPTRR